MIMEKGDSMNQSTNGTRDRPGNVSEEIMNALQQLLQQAERQRQEQDLRNLIANSGTTSLQSILHLQGISSLLNGSLNPSHGPPRPPPPTAAPTQQPDAARLASLLLGTHNNRNSHPVSSTVQPERAAAAAAAATVASRLATLAPIFGGERLPENSAGSCRSGVGNALHSQQASDYVAKSTVAAKQRQKSGGGTSNSSNRGGTIVPCRARGISKDHSKKTAYFVIQDNVKHGADLRCSHVECQNKGIRFVYCIVCDEPVAKINFKTRHSHLDILGPLTASMDTSSIRRKRERPASTTSNASSGLPSLISQKRKIEGGGNSDRQEGEPKIEKRQKIKNLASATEDSEKPSSFIPVGKHKENGGSTSPSMPFCQPVPALGSVVAQAFVPGLSMNSKTITSTPSKTDTPKSQEDTLPKKMHRPTKESATSLETESSMTSKLSSGVSAGAMSESESNRCMLQTATASEKASSGNDADTATDYLYSGSEIESASGVVDGNRSSGRGTPTTATAATAASGSCSPTNNNIAVTDEVESDWIALLRQRPNSKKPKRLKAWIDRVLHFSERLAPPSDDDSDDSDLE